jgi:hypothetical protein
MDDSSLNEESNEFENADCYDGDDDGDCGTDGSSTP